MSGVEAKGGFGGSGEGYCTLYSILKNILVARSGYMVKSATAFK